jgi:membrane-associated phospholipid phosphatase
MAAGAHFFSDVVFAGVLMYLVIWTAHGLIYRWSATRLDEKALEDWLGKIGQSLSGLGGRLARRGKKASG